MYIYILYYTVPQVLACPSHPKVADLPKDLPIDLDTCNLSGFVSGQPGKDTT